MTKSSLRLSFVILISVMVVSGSGCNLLDNKQEGDLIPAELAEQFQLMVHQTAFIQSENIKITFSDVTEDSRCPSDVVCVWAGQIEVVVSILKNGENLGDLTLTGRAGEELATATFDGYSVRLVQADPYPVSTETIELSDYIITLVVTKSG